MKPHPNAGELTMAFDVWHDLNAVPDTAVKHMLWNLAIESSGMSAPDRLTLIALAFHYDVVTAAGRRYVGADPAELMVWSGLPVQVLRPKLMWLSGRGYVEVVKGAPRRFRLARSLMDKIARSEATTDVDV